MEVWFVIKWSETYWNVTFDLVGTKPETERRRKVWLSNKNELKMFHGLGSQSKLEYWWKSTHLFSNSLLLYDLASISSSASLACMYKKAVDRHNLQKETSLGTAKWSSQKTIALVVSPKLTPFDTKIRTIVQTSIHLGSFGSHGKLLIPYMVTPQIKSGLDLLLNLKFDHQVVGSSHVSGRCRLPLEELHNSPTGRGPKYRLPQISHDAAFTTYHIL